MKPSDKVAWINTWLVDSPYYIGLCKSEEGFKRELKRLSVPRDSWPEWIPKRKDGSTHCFESKDGRLCVIICIRKAKGHELDAIGLLIHEAVHAWQEIREELGEDNPSSEFEAYSIQAISQRLIAEYRK